MTETDIMLMREAIALANSCEPTKDSIPKVGAVIAIGGTIIGKGRRGSGNPGDNEHAEHMAFLSVADRRELPKATVYATLEPCTPEVRSKPLECCTEQILRAKVSKVWIGILDPNQGVRGKGFWELDRRVEVEFFPSEMRRAILAMNEPFIRYQLTVGARIVAPIPGQEIALKQGDKGGWFGRCMVVCDCANDPDPSIKIVIQRGGEWWPAPNELHRVAGTRQWQAEVYFGADGDHTIHIVKTTEAGAVLFGYYQDVVNRNIERQKELDRRCGHHKLPSNFLEKLPGNFQGIKMGGFPKGLESQAHVQVRVIKT